MSEHVNHRGIIHFALYFDIIKQSEVDKQAALSYNEIRKNLTSAHHNLHRRLSVSNNFAYAYASLNGTTAEIHSLRPQEPRVSFRYDNDITVIDCYLPTNETATSQSYDILK